MLGPDPVGSISIRKATSNWPVRVLPLLESVFRRTGVRTWLRPAGSVGGVVKRRQ